MSEQGTAFSADLAGGFIDAGSASPVSYDAGVVEGPMPRDGETVSFDRVAGDETRAASVRVVTFDAASIADDLRSAFNAHFDTVTVTDRARDEVSRLASDRAERILRPLGGADVPAAVLQARIDFARAAMSMMAIEATAMGESEVKAEHLREILRRQRPKLPR